MGVAPADDVGMVRVRVSLVRVRVRVSLVRVRV